VQDDATVAAVIRSLTTLPGISRTDTVRAMHGDSIAIR
jgi:hypothetical protein